MKKIFTLLTVLLVFSMVLVACGPNEPVVNEPDNNVVEENNDDNANDTTTEEEEEEEVVEVPRTTRQGGWLDQVSMSIVAAEAAVTQIEAGAVDIYASNLSTPADMEAIREAGLERSSQFGLYYELTLNPAGDDAHRFPGTGKLNPFDVPAVREAMNWLVDRQYISDEIYGGTAIPKFFSIVSGFPDYARYVEYIRGFEAKYAYNFEKAEGIFTTEMEAMGAVKGDDGMWYDGDDIVELIILIRTDSDGTRVPIGEYTASQLEALGFAVTRTYGTSSELSAIWVAGDIDDGLFHLYTGAWGSSSISRDDGSDFEFFLTPDSVYGFTTLWAGYDDVSPEYQALVTSLANNEFSTLEERAEMFQAAMEGSFELGYRIWLVDGLGASVWKPGVEVAYDLSAGVDINRLWPHTLRMTESEGGQLNWGTPDLFVDPANPIGGSNWTYDSQWQIAVSDQDTLRNPHTGIPLPQRIESAELYIQEDLPVGQTYDWLTMTTVATNEVPGDAWIGWDPVAQNFLTVDEVHPDGLEALRKVVYTYPADMFDTVSWHDGSAFSMADFVMGMIMSFTNGTEGDPLYDESQAGALSSWLTTFKGFKIVSTDPPVFEYYSDTWYMDAELNATGAFWPEYGYGNAPWHMMAVSNLAEAAGTLAYTADKADALEVEWMNFIGGPSLEIFDGYVDEALAASLVPYADILGEYVTAEEAAARYANLKAFYGDYGHFWVGTGPYILDQVFLVEKTATLVHNPNYVDLSDKWAQFSEPKLATVDVDGPGIVAIGSEAVFDVFVTYGGEAYPGDEIDQVKYLVFDATGELVEVAQGEYVDDGYYTITLSAETTALLAAGSNKIEVAVVAIPVSIPSFGAIEFVTE